MFRNPFSGHINNKWFISIGPRSAKFWHPKQDKTPWAISGAMGLQKNRWHFKLSGCFSFWYVNKVGRTWYFKLITVTINAHVGHLSLNGRRYSYYVVNNQNVCPSLYESAVLYTARSVMHDAKAMCLQCRKKRCFKRMFRTVPAKWVVRVMDFGMVKWFDLPDRI
jgi:hypothetical protein